MFFKNSFSIRLSVVAQWTWPGSQLKLGLQKVYVRRKKNKKEIDKLDIILNFVNKKNK
jgi:hypothetical protein